jgi:predicted metal-dependent phosphoesterase TrpH
MIDLHSHTTASDGQHAPEVLIQMAKAAGVLTLAVTDHDTVAGLGRAAQAARAEGIALVNGIELSAFINNREVHILGHFVDAEDQDLAGFSVLLRTERETRMERMVAKMNGMGFPVTMAEVKTLAGEGQLGRPHLARVLVEKRYCLSTKEAFDRFLADGKPGWVDRYRLTSEKAIELIRNSGGAATVAHPGVSKVNPYELAQMKAAGLVGLEVFHSDHVPSMKEKLLEEARKLDLVPTAGSDFHGEKVAPGRRLGSASMDPAIFDALNQRAGRG